ncbi:hypothetical protein KDL01_22290 [Actinospica durhamensis]|uniref:non-specific serine/threonine protein kinase n=1 Tax=Actinospica durhamensis TaxID=1508375 RepID=A0A941IS58_9ACTN|nr:COR domain-containing protein [Actinospica durhamensis]MBR7836022.1 hypothetical protein [Actinospica durhamensis]
MRRLTKLTSISLSIDERFSFPSWFVELGSLSQISLNTHPPGDQAAGDIQRAASPRLTSLSWMVSDLDVTLDEDWIPALPRLTDLSLIGDRVQHTPGVDLEHLLARASEHRRCETGVTARPPRRNVRSHQSQRRPLFAYRTSRLVRNARVRTRSSSRTMKNPPPEVMDQGSEAILAYLRARTARAPIRQWASKLLIVGEATVGKTSLAKQLTGGRYDPNEGQTHGVHIDPLALVHPSEPDITMQIRVWDFGGQLEYRATQRFYLTDRSLFILVWNARARWRDGKVTAWLDVIAARAPQSPILIVATHGDEPSAATLPSDLRARYPQIAGVFTVDSSTGNGIGELEAAVREQAAELPLMGTTWPASWAAAGDAVRALPGYTATARHVWQSMEAAGVDDQTGRQVIARSLHDLGDIVYFADDPELAKKMILHPSWLDARISAVLDSQVVADARGMLSRAERDRIWGDLDDPDLSDRLVRMMERFDLAYRIGDAETSDMVALIVERLDEARPPAADVMWAQAGQEPDFRELGIAYQLKSRQAGIPTWFIAREHRYTTGVHWAHGALLHDRDPAHPSWAMLVDDGREQPTIELRVRGRFPVRFLSVLAEAFERILDQRYPGLLEQRLVPCICTPKTFGACAHLFSLDQLIYEATDRDPGADGKVRCPKTGKRLDARTMLDGLRGSALEAAIDSMRHDVDTVLKAVDRQTTSLERIDQHGLSTLNGLRTLLEHRADAGLHCPSLFEIEDIGRTGFPPARTLELRLWCEWPYGPHGPHALASGVGVYHVRKLPPWLSEYLPYLTALATTLGLIVPLAGPGLAAAGVQLTERTKAGFEFAAKFTEDLTESALSRTPSGLPRAKPADGPRRLAEIGADFRALRAALIKLDPRQEWGGLTARERPGDRRIVYLCREHVRAMEYPYAAAAPS